MEQLLARTNNYPFTINHYLGAETQNRTVDTSIFNAVLYLLSYLGKKIAPFGAKLSNLTLCLAQSHFCFYASHKRFTERAMRFELTTFSLARRHSTAELRPH